MPNAHVSVMPLRPSVYMRTHRLMVDSHFALLVACMFASLALDVSLRVVVFPGVFASAARMCVGVARSCQLHAVAQIRARVL